MQSFTSSMKSPRSHRVAGRLVAGLLIGAALLTFAAARLRAGEKPAARPNIIFILTDDQDYDEMGCYEGAMPTPQMDRLARDGIRFTRQYAAPLCGPSRYNFLTGRYASRRINLATKYPVSGPAFITHGDIPIVGAEKYTLASVLRAAGYATGMCGKWHQGTLKPLHPIAKEADANDPTVARHLVENYENLQASVKSWGFDYADGLYRGNRNELNFLPTSLALHNMEWETKAVLDFIDGHHDRPFFMFFAPTLVHDSSMESLQSDPALTPRGRVEFVSPMPSRASVIERAKAVKGAKLDKAAASIWLDDGIGAILKKLSDLGLEKNTLIVLVSDNANIAKMSCYEGGARTPCLARFPSVIPAGAVSDALISHLDFIPTALALAGVTPPREMVMDGKDITAALRHDPGYRRESIFIEVAYQRAVITGDGWKYLVNRFPPGFVPSEKGPQMWLGVTKNRHQFPAYDEPDQIYNLNADPGEQHNLYRDGAVQAQRERLLAMMNAYSATLPNHFGEFPAAE